MKEIFAQLSESTDYPDLVMAQKGKPEVYLLIRLIFFSSAYYLITLSLSTT